MKKTNLYFLICILLALVIFNLWFFVFRKSKLSPNLPITNFAQCEKALGSKITLSYPAVCVTIDGKRFLQKEENPVKVYPLTKNFCPELRPEVCTQECINPPPYLCGSNGKSYCTVCQACSDSEVDWWTYQDTNC